ncbi:hypothetical protein SAMN05421797_10329 [Maribacter ulvicola]|uniref:Uncharacterized protein n=1 Tax=Maribacter ulvicola TaxID=228959 RepID=A0A1N6V810_9FLAO|nr:hypothetical protein SAMN05421797_10329 [Maribacter ulvicola]
MLWLILWRKDQKIIQIGIDTRYEEQGFRNQLSEIEPLNEC